MSRRKSIATRQIHAEHWDAHETVLIRSLNTDDDEYIQDDLATVDDKGATHLHAGRLKRLTLQRGIVSWTFTDEQGRPLPLCEQSIKELAQEDSQYIFSAINALNAPMSNAEKKDSATPATTGDVEKAKSSHSQP